MKQVLAALVALSPFCLHAKTEPELAGRYQVDVRSVPSRQRDTVRKIFGDDPVRFFEGGSFIIPRWEAEGRVVRGRLVFDQFFSADVQVLRGIAALPLDVPVPADLRRSVPLMNPALTQASVNRAGPNRLRLAFPSAAFGAVVLVKQPDWSYEQTLKTWEESLDHAGVAGTEAWYVMRHRADRWLPDLLQTARGPDRMKAISALLFLESVQPSLRTPALERLIGDPTIRPRVRVQATRLLSRVAGPKSEQLILQLFGEGRLPTEATAGFLAEAGSARSLVLVRSLLKHERSGSRRSALRALARSGGAADARWAEERTNDPDLEARIAALEAVLRLSDDQDARQSAVRRLIDLFPTVDWLLKHSILDALAHANGSEVVRFYESTLRNVEPGVQAEAATGLGRLGDRKHLAALAGLLDSNRVSQVAAYRAILQILTRVGPKQGRETPRTPAQGAHTGRDCGLLRATRPIQPVAAPPSGRSTVTLGNGFSDK